MQDSDRDVHFALLNIQSLNNKSAITCNLIEDNAYDMLVLTETWHACSSDLSLCRAAPCGYSTIDAPRPSHDGSGGDVNHGGIAVIHRNVFSSCAISTPLRPTSFEHLICLLSAVHCKLILVTVYRPSTLNITDVFFEELTTLLKSV